jgi:hypothetical protein
MSPAISNNNFRYRKGTFTIPLKDSPNSIGPRRARLQTQLLGNFCKPSKSTKILAVRFQLINLKITWRAQEYWRFSKQVLVFRQT